MTLKKHCWMESKLKRSPLPLKYTDVRKLENLNPDICITVFGYDDTEKNIVGSHYFEMDGKFTPIKMLLLQNGKDETKFHYGSIKNISRLVILHNLF